MPISQNKNCNKKPSAFAAEGFDFVLTPHIFARGKLSAATATTATVSYEPAFFQNRAAVCFDTPPVVYQYSRIVNGGNPRYRLKAWAFAVAAASPFAEAVACDVRL